MGVLHVSADACGGQKGGILLELEIQVGASCPKWVPGTKLISAGRTAHTLGC